MKILNLNYKIFKINNKNKNKNKNFCAKFVSSQFVKKPGNKNLKVSIVELYNLEEYNNFDKNALANLTKIWNTPYLTSIYEELSSKKSQNTIKTHIYALTSQDNNYEKLNEMQILGVAKFEEYEGYNNLKYIQTNPRCIKKQNNKPLFSGVGTAILNFLKDKFSTKRIILNSDYHAQGFYEKNDFILYDDEEKGSFLYIWHPENDN